jgi:two-component system C4-dicarboxylate transport response regulator DctD
MKNRLIVAALTRNEGNATKTAAALKLPRKTFYDKLARHNIRPESYR